jgi:hypothetical protein
MSESAKETNYFDCLVYLAGTVAGICVAVVAMFVMFANHSSAMMVCAYIVGALCVMGLGLGVMASKHETVQASRRQGQAVTSAANSAR